MNKLPEGFTAPPKPEPVFDECWKTEDGRILRVCDMEEQHVRAVLNMIIKNRRKHRELKRDLRRTQRWMEDALDDDAKWGRS